MTLPGQLDLFYHDPARLARTYRVAADQVRATGGRDHFDQQELIAHYTAEAERLEALAGMTRNAA